MTDLKRVEEDLRRNLEEQRVIAAVAEAPADAEDEEELLARTTELLRDAFFPENCGFLLLDAERRAPPPRALLPLAAQRGRAHPGRRGQGVVGRVAATGEARRLDDAAEPGYLPSTPACGRRSACP